MELVFDQFTDYKNTHHLRYLWKDDLRNIYLMDNHMAAIWCWENILPRASRKIEKRYLLHIDRHSDENNSLIRTLRDDLLKEYLRIKYISIKAFSEKYDRENNCFMHTWSNYIGLYLKLYKHSVKTYSIIGTPYGWSEMTHRLQFLVKKIINNSQDLLIVNFDLDCLYESSGKRVETDKKTVVIFLKELNNSFENSDSKDRIVLTIALSPEMCGGVLNMIQDIKLLITELNLKPDLEKIINL